MVVIAVSGFKSDRIALTFLERAAFSELAGELQLPKIMFEDPDLQEKVSEAFDQAEIPRYRDELEPGAYEALLEWIELRPETDKLRFDDGEEVEIHATPLFGQAEDEPETMN